MKAGRLWAPWRTRYLAMKPERRCIFCLAKTPGHDRRRLVVARGRHTFALLNLYPYNNGHVMVAPSRHIGDLAKLRPAEWAEMLTLSQALLRKLKQALRPHGFNLGMNLGRVGGAGIPGHLHLHLVPRWSGDTNFMPILAGTKVISQSLEDVRRLLTQGRR